MTELEQLEQAIAALEAQRAVLGDAVVNTALAPMRDKLGALKAAQAPAEAQRKLATVLFADVSGFTALSETLDAEEVTEVMNGLWQRLDHAITSHGGRIDKHIGDAVMALWGVEQAREDDPERAVRAALALQAIVSEERGRRNEEHRSAGPSSFIAQPLSLLHLRIGLNTGPVLLGQVGSTREFTAMGDAVNLASRLEHAAPLDGILISHAVYRHVRGVFDVQALDPLTVRGKAEPVQVYVVKGAKPRAFHTPTRGVEGVETPMVGRETELKALQHAFETAVEDHELQVVTVIGDAGVGKSRLLSEFEQWLDLGAQEVWYFKGRAEAGTQVLPYALLRDMLAFRFEIRDSDPLGVARAKLEQGVVGFMPGDPTAVEKAHFIGHLLGFDFSASPHLAGVLHDSAQVRQRAFYYLTQFFRAVTGSHPAVILLEDLHWADDASLDLLDYLARELRSNPQATGRERGVPLLIIGLARPALFERRPLWGEGWDFHLRLALRPLDRQDSRRLVGELLRRVGSVPTELRDTLVAGAEGNPFYLEELVKMLVEAGVIATRVEPWRVDLQRLNAVRVPPTLVGVLQARLDALSPAERETLKRASVVGQVFWDAVVAQLAGLGQGDLAGYVTPDALSASLHALRRRELVYGREASQFAGAQEYTFKHALLRDVTYETVLLRERRPLHAQAARWLVERSGDRADEYAALIAEHYERAGAMGAAAEWYARAARQAQGVYANQAAITLYEKCLSLMGTEDGGRKTDEGTVSASVVGPPSSVELLLALGDVLTLVGRYVEAETRYREALERATGEPRVEARTQLALGRLMERRGEYDAALDWLTQAGARFEALGDEVGLGQVWTAIGLVGYRQGNYPQALDSLDKGLRLARVTGDKPSIALALNWMGNATSGQGNYAEAQPLFEESLMLAREMGDKQVIATCLNYLSALAFLSGDQAAASSLLKTSLTLRREIGDREGIAASLGNLGNVAWFSGDLSAAQALYEESLALDQEIGNKWGIALALNNLGNIAWSRGDMAAAQVLHEESLARAREIGDQQGIALSLNNLGNVAWRRGDTTLTRGLYKESLVLRREIGEKWAIVSSLAGLAVVAGAAGQPERAARLVGAAQALREVLGTILDPADQALYDAAVAAARAGLSAEAFEAAWAEGQAMPLEEAVAYALEEGDET